MMSSSNPLLVRMRALKAAADRNVSAIAAFLLLLWAVLSFSPFAPAQGQEFTVGTAIEVARADMQSQRTQIVTTVMGLNDKDAATFWPIYRKFDYERSVVDDRRAAVIKEYADKNATLSDADAKSMVLRLFACDAEYTELKKKYFREFNRVLPAATVAKFFQLDRRLDLLMDMKVESALPPLQIPGSTPSPEAQVPPTSPTPDLQQER